MTSKTHTALIVDDEKDARDLIKYMLKEFEEIEVVAEAENTESALLKFIETKPDIVFLDLVMPGKNGMEFIELIQRQNLETNIVIVSAYRDMAIEAIKNEVYDFLLKPIGPRKFKTLVKKILQRIDKSQKVELDKLLNSVKVDTLLKLSSTNSHVLIDPDDILFCTAEGSYTHIHLDDGKVELANTYLGKIEDILENYSFFRIGRSHLINLDKLWRANKSDNSCILRAKEKEVKLYGSKKQIKELCKIDLRD
ncbi:MAG TPA: LytTR family DNA-binding domain-containing protein [Sunxiuqinia sp.]|nr:LytTR family DNA-binding domain-containing protein [Sunxiuqinia sp.]